MHQLSRKRAGSISSKRTCRELRQALQRMTLIRLHHRTRCSHANATLLLQPILFWCLLLLFWCRPPPPHTHGRGLRCGHARFFYPPTSYS